MIETNILFLIIVGISVAAAASYLGSFMVLKRMSLVGDALSHVALPGIAIAISLNLSPIIGAFIFLLLATILVWYLEETSEVYPEALIGILFTASLALGVLITKEPDLLEALFGNIEEITLGEGIVAVFLSVITIIFTYLISRGLLVGVISKEMAKSAGFNIRRINFFYLLLVAVVVALGVKFVGTLLTGALVIVPAASAKNVSRGISTYHFLSILFSIASAVFGIVISKLFGLPIGPLVVLSGVLIFAFTYILKRLLSY